MTENETCDTCRWWSEFGRCRRYPPTVMPLVITTTETGFEVTDVEAATPETPPDFWCGEHDPKHI